MARLYVQQLLNEGDVRKAVSYAIASGQRSQAVEIFMNHQLYRESVALARCLYADGSAEVHESIGRWAEKAIQDGNMELATKCLLANGGTGEAARVLARRSDVASLKLSADLANGAGLDQLATAYLDRASELAQQAAAEPKPADVSAAIGALNLDGKEGEPEVKEEKAAEKLDE